MSYSIDIPLATLRAVRTHAAITDVRYYLNGIYFDTLNGRLVSTDGHRCMICHLDKIPAPDAEKFIISNDTIDLVLKAYDSSGFKAHTTRGEILVTVLIERKISHDAEYNADVKHPLKVQFKVPSGFVEGSELDGLYPDITRIIPDKVTGELSHFNARYIYEAQKATSILQNKTSKETKSGNDTPFLAHNGTSAGVIISTDTLGNKALIIIMPIMRLGANVSDSIQAVNELLSTYKA